MSIVTGIIAWFASNQWLLIFLPILISWFRNGMPGGFMGILQEFLKIFKNENEEKDSLEGLLSDLERIVAKCEDCEEVVEAKAVLSNHLWEHHKDEIYRSMKEKASK